MTPARITGNIVLAASLGIVGCASAPTGDQESMPGLSIASVHSDITFTLTASARQSASCAAKALCQTQGEAGAVIQTPFAAQVQRVAERLQEGVRDLYPDIEQRVPGFALSGFDVYVATDGPGSDSSAGGRIALSAGLSALNPYDDWLAFVIAREMGHVIARHHEENSTVSLVTSLVMNILLPGSGLVKSAASKVGSELAISSNREQQATQADAIAVRLLEAAGFRLRDVALSLVVAPAGLDESVWSHRFRKSADRLVAGVRPSKLAVAPGVPLEKDQI